MGGAHLVLEDEVVEDEAVVLLVHPVDPVAGPAKPVRFWDRHGEVQTPPFGPRLRRGDWGRLLSLQDNGVSLLAAVAHGAPHLGSQPV